jgi:hypothetical protein
METPTKRSRSRNTRHRTREAALLPSNRVILFGAIQDDYSSLEAARMPPSAVAFAFSPISTSHRMIKNRSLPIQYFAEGYLVWTGGTCQPATAIRFRYPNGEVD